MPIYEYRCVKCSHVFDAFQRVGADGSNLQCPVCGAEKPEKLFSAFAASGFDHSTGSIAGNGGCGSHGGFT